jgi:hypothetical protein
MTKPKWQPGQPTKTGWCWFLFENGYKTIWDTSDEDIANWPPMIRNVRQEDGSIKSFSITHHCPIEEPEE